MAGVSWQIAHSTSAQLWLFGVHAVQIVLDPPRLPLELSKLLPLDLVLVLV